MTRETWGRLTELFGHALELSRDERHAFLIRFRVDDPAAAIELESLLTEHEREGVSLPIIHCDIKAENVLVTARGTVKLLDFGIARLLDQLEPSRSIALRRRPSRAPNSFAEIRSPCRPTCTR